MRWWYCFWWSWQWLFSTQYDGYNAFTSSYKHKSILFFHSHSTENINNNFNKNSYISLSQTIHIHNNYSKILSDVHLYIQSLLHSRSIDANPFFFLIKWHRCIIIFNVNCLLFCFPLKIHFDWQKEIFEIGANFSLIKICFFVKSFDL